MDLAATLPAGNNVARNDNATKVARQRLTTEIARHRYRFSLGSVFIDPELLQAL